MCIALVCNNRVAGVFVDVLVMLHAVCLLFQMGLHVVLDSYFVFFLARCYCPLVIAVGSGSFLVISCCCVHNCPYVLYESARDDTVHAGQ